MYFKSGSFVRCALGVAALLFASLSHGALFSRLGGLAVYDDVLDATWIADANLAASETFGVAGIGVPGPNGQGLMQWDKAQEWLSALNSANYLGFDDWRIPGTPRYTGCINYNCTDSDMGELFYVGLGGVAGQRIDFTHNASYDLFTNLGPFNYWSTEAGDPGGALAWAFGTGDLGQFTSPKINSFRAMVLRGGDVTLGASPVPEPGTWAMLLAGFAVLGLTGRTKSRQ